MVDHTYGTTNAIAAAWNSDMLIGKPPPTFEYAPQTRAVLVVVGVCSSWPHVHQPYSKEHLSGIMNA